MVQGVLKNGKFLKWAKNIYMISTNTIALPKKFSIVSWSLLGTFCPQYMDILIQSVFSPYRVS